LHLTSLLLKTLLPAFVLAICLTPLIILVGKKSNIVDHPGVRKIHTSSIPLLGGLSIYLTAIILIPIVNFFFFDYLVINREFIGLFIGGTIMIALGMVDDKIGLSAKEKFIFQSLAALVVSIMGWNIQNISIPYLDGGITLGLISIPFSVIWYVGIINAVNMIDGMDGAASGIAAIALSFCAYIFYFYGQNDLMLMSLIIIGALFGFLTFNFNPAKIFLGDTGSLFLGFILALFATKAPSLATPIGGHYINSCSILVSISILFYPLLDISFALMRRIAKGSSIYKPDKSHIHHKLLVYFSWNPKICALFIYFLGLCGGMCGIMIFNRNTEGLVGAGLLYTSILFYIFNKFQYRESISNTSKIQKNKTRTLLYLTKMMDQKIELANNINEINRILEWIMEETEIEGLELISDEKSMLTLGIAPLSSSSISFPMPSIKGKIRIKYKTAEYYHAELERDLCLQDLSQKINIALQYIIKKDS
jgi:UDP-GlcNAc:undecaprenyl-phosphate GlcNAc-1-phosphate transferase